MSKSKKNADQSAGKVTPKTDDAAPGDHPKTLLDPEPAPEKPADKPKPKAKKKRPVGPPPAPDKPLVALRVFVGVCGKKPDQMAGFRYHAKASKFRRMTVEAWHAEYKNFMTSPTK